MPAIVGAFKINAVGTSGVVHIGDCITISPKARSRHLRVQAALLQETISRLRITKIRPMCTIKIWSISRSRAMLKGVHAS